MCLFCFACSQITETYSRKDKWKHWAFCWFQKFFMSTVLVSKATHKDLVKEGLLTFTVHSQIIMETQKRDTCRCCVHLMLGLSPHIVM